MPTTSQRPVVGNHPPGPNEVQVGDVVLVGERRLLAGIRPRGTRSSSATSH